MILEILIGDSRQCLGKVKNSLLITYYSLLQASFMLICQPFFPSPVLGVVLAKLLSELARYNEDYNLVSSEIHAKT